VAPSRAEGFHPYSGAPSYCPPTVKPPHSWSEGEEGREKEEGKGRREARDHEKGKKKKRKRGSEW
jgi:hypothetical protein